MNSRLLRGFRIGNFTILPLDGEFRTEDGITHVQPKAMEVLMALASKPQQVVPRQDLLDEVWPDVVVGDEVLTRCIHEIRHALHDDPSNPQLIATIPKRGYRLLVPVELASAKVDSEPARRGRLLAWISVLVIVIAAGLLLLVKIPDREVTPLAVIRFCNIGDDPGNEYYSDGIADDILDFLGANNALRVSARTSSFRFDCKSATIPEITRRLSVEYVVEGSVRRDGDELKISASLVDAAGFSVWSKTYARDSSSVFNITADIAQSVLQELGADISELTREAWQLRLPASLLAYDYYKLGRFYLAKRAPSEILRAIEMFEVAVEKDEAFALARTGIADSYALLAVYGNMSESEAAQKMKKSVNIALALDENLPEAYTSYGSYLELMGNYEGAAEAYRRAIALKPSYALAHMWLGHVLLLRNKITEATEHYRHAYELDRLNVTAGANVAKSLAYMGRYEEAVELLDQLRDEFPNELASYHGTALWANAYGRFDKAFDAAQSGLEISPNDPISTSLLGQANLNLGRGEDARRILLQGLENAPQNWHMISLFLESLFVAGDFGLMDEFMEEQLRQTEERKGDVAPRAMRNIYLRAGLAKLLNGDPQRASELLDAGFLDAGQTQLDADDEVMFLGYRALAHRGAGNEDVAQQVLQQALVFSEKVQRDGWGMPHLYARISAIHALLGDDTQAIEALARAESRGYRRYGFLARDPVWDSLRNKPAFERIAGRMQDSIREMNSNMFR